MAHMAFGSLLGAIQGSGNHLHGPKAPEFRIELSKGNVPLELDRRGDVGFGDWERQLKPS